MKLKGLTLVFENCEHITIDGKNIGKLKLKDFFDISYEKFCDDRPIISHIEGVKTVFLEILKDANVERAPFDEDLNTPYGQKNKHTVFERIQKYKDVCWIDLDLELEEGDEGEIPNPSYFIHWTGKSEEENKGQYTYLSKPGNLYVYITDKPFIKHKFKKSICMKYINNPLNYDEEYKAKRLEEIEKEMNRPPSYEDWLLRTAQYSEDAKEVTYEDLAKDMGKYVEYLKWLGENYPEEAKKEAIQNFIRIGLYNEDGTPNENYYPKEEK